MQNQLSQAARQAAAQGNWQAVKQCADKILQLDAGSAEGWFLSALVAKARGLFADASAAFAKALAADNQRYDAAVELSVLRWQGGQHQQAKELLMKHATQWQKSPKYAFLAADTFTKLGLHDLAYSHYQTALALQPSIEHFQLGLAACATLVGEIDQAKGIYTSVLNRNPAHQRCHYELSRLARAENRDHVDAMLRVLDASESADEKNIFLLYAIGKELEDLNEWPEAFRYYQRAGRAARRVAHDAGYRVEQDIATIDTVRELCDRAWLAQPAAQGVSAHSPIFVVGLPRTGTTLVERILASHSCVETADESFFLPMAIKRVSGVGGREAMSPQILRAAAKTSTVDIGEQYLESIAYRLEGRPHFVEKYPFNYLYLGFIARALPDAKIVFVDRDPMDACFAMFKQSYFQFAYTLDDLSAYYIAYAKLRQHWQSLMADRIISVRYEDLVASPEETIRRLLSRLGLDFEAGCLNFHQTKKASATASAVQVREPMHTRSVGKWKHWQSELSQLRSALEEHNLLE